MENKYKKLAKNTFWTLTGNAGSKLLSFLMLPLYTRWLGTAGFGESDLVTTYSSFLVCIMTMCIADGIFVFTKNENLPEKKSYFTSSLIFIIVILIIWMAIWMGMDFIFQSNHIKNSFSNNLWLIYGIVVTTFLQQYCQQFILSLEKIKIFSLTGIVHSIFTLLMSYLLIPQMGVTGYIYSIIFANLITAFYTFLFSRSYHYISFRTLDLHKVPVMLKYTVPLIPNGVMWWLVSALNRPVMEYHLDYSAIGVFSVANRFPSVITMVFSVFSVAWNISVFEEYNKEGYESFYKTTFRMLFFLIVVVASVVMLFSEQIVAIFAAPEFIDAWKYMVILVIGAVFSCMSGYFGTNFGVVKKSKYFFYSSVWGALTSVVLNFLLIPIWGLGGAATSVCFSFAVMMLSRYVYSTKYVGVSLIGCISKYVIVLLLVAGCVLMIPTFLYKIIVSFILLSVYIMTEMELVMPLLKRTIKRSHFKFVP